MSESKLRAPYIVRHISLEEIERGQRLQKAMEELDDLEAKKLADDLRADEAARRVESERAAIEEARRAASASGKIMNAKYGWVNNTTKGWG
jgi:DNA topoisomerase IB